MSYFILLFYTRNGPYPFLLNISIPETVQSSDLWFFTRRRNRCAIISWTHLELLRLVH